MVTDFSEEIAAFFFRVKTLKMKAASFCETSVTVHQPTWHSIRQTLTH
jgi:hypothetical protein